MVNIGSDNCPRCGGNLRYYDTVKRILLGKYGVSKYIFVERYICTVCKSIHRVLPDNVLPYKRYEKEVVTGVVYGYITCETIGFEDYPCDTTMQRWINTSRNFPTPL